MDCQSKRTLMGLAEYVAGELGIGLVSALISHMTHRLVSVAAAGSSRSATHGSPHLPRRRRNSSRRGGSGAAGIPPKLRNGKWAGHLVQRRISPRGSRTSPLGWEINILFRRCGSGATRSWRRCGKDKRSIWFNAPVEVDRLGLHDYHTVIKWEITLEEKNLLRVGLESLPEKKMHNVLQIVRKRNGNPELVGGEIELDIDEMDVETQWELDRFVNNFKKALNKSRRAAIVNGENADVIDASVANDSYVLVNGSTATMVDNGDVAMAIESKDPDKITTQAEQLDEYVDIGDEMPTATLSLNIHRPAIRRPGEKNANSNLPISGD
ncbi:hypothetical protein OsI_17464 [Oryza sativa Indica Group]|uniref:NET domain-containing protein n=1 Tax=Oryza sativa subsp. indica TaxID=39946 RepID=B8AUH4_ORYSI|nr:hypothetical protein OsI_17464 [Oryza sativa Indica Group]